MMILKVARGEDGDEQDLAITGLGEAMVAVAQAAQDIVNNHEGGYNLHIVHGAAPPSGVVWQSPS
jgi:hypothetical protein